VVLFAQVSFSSLEERSPMCGKIPDSTAVGKVKSFYDQLALTLTE